MALEFSSDQERALLEVMEWRATSSKQFLTLGGYAGTGKTTLVSHLATDWNGVAVCALCGKAAQVLRDKGVQATTIHGLIYIPRKTADGRTRYVRRSHLDSAQTIIVDEASMIDHLLLQDLLSYKIKVLFVGDHGQLEPIGTNPNLMKNPDVRLENIHRQARDNPILRLATAFREGRPVQNWSNKGGRLDIVSKRDFRRRARRDWQLICGFNKTRQQVNDWIRSMAGHKQHLVCPDERLICLRNNKQWQLFNGQQVRVLDVGNENRRAISLEIETDDGRCFTVEALKAQFARPLITDFRSQGVALFDYGYCITAHKAQGSEWDSVVALEEIQARWDSKRWRYTVATRAKERLVYCH